MSHPDLLKFCQSVLLLSHGQANENEWPHSQNSAYQGTPGLCCFREVTLQAIPGKSIEKEGECHTRAKEESRRERTGGPPEPGSDFDA